MPRVKYSKPVHTWTSSREVISVSLHMSVITQVGDSALMMAVRMGRTEVVPLLLEAEANNDLQNKVHVRVHVQMVL